MSRATQTYLSVHGTATSQTSVMMDGMINNGLQNGGAAQSYMNDAGLSGLGSIWIFRGGKRIVVV